MMYLSEQMSARAAWHGFDSSITRFSCDRLRLFVRVLCQRICILLRCCRRRRPRGELQDKGEGLDNPLCAGGTWYELRGIGLLVCGKPVAFGRAWHGERIIVLFRYWQRCCSVAYYIFEWIMNQRETYWHNDNAALMLI